MLIAVEFDGDAGGFAEKIDFHFAEAVEGDGEGSIEAKVALGFGQPSTIISYETNGENRA